MLQKSNICQYRPLTFFENNAIFSQNPSSCNRATIFYTLTNRKARFSSNHPGNGNERFARTKMQSNTNIGTQIATSAKQKKAKKESPEFRVVTRHSGLFLAESKGFEPSNTRLDVTRFPIVLLRPLGQLSVKCESQYTRGIAKCKQKSWHFLKRLGTVWFRSPVFGLRNDS